MHFGSRINGFSSFGFAGIVIIIVYLTLIFCCVKTYNFIFSKIVLLIYVFLLVWLSFLFNTNITSANCGWLQVLLFCVSVDGLIYLINKNKK